MQSLSTQYKSEQTEKVSGTSLLFRNTNLLKLNEKFEK